MQGKRKFYRELSLTLKRYDAQSMIPLQRNLQGDFKIWGREWQVKTVFSIYYFLYIF